MNYKVIILNSFIHLSFFVTVVFISQIANYVTIVF